MGPPEAENWGRRLSGRWVVPKAPPPKGCRPPGAGDPSRDGAAAGLPALPPRKLMRGRPESGAGLALCRFRVSDVVRLMLGDRPPPLAATAEAAPKMQLAGLEGTLTTPERWEVSEVAAEQWSRLQVGMQL